MERRDSNCSVRTAIAPEQEHDLEPAVPIVAYLGPISSYTHQVFTLIQYTRPAWSIGLTDFDLAQTALQCFKSDEYDYKPQTTITGSTLASNTLTSRVLSNLKVSQMSSKPFNQEKQRSASFPSRIRQMEQLSSLSSSSQTATHSSLTF